MKLTPILYLFLFICNINGMQTTHPIVSWKNTQCYIEPRRCFVSPDGKTVAIKPSKIGDSTLNLIDRHNSTLESISIPGGFADCTFHNASTLFVGLKNNSIRRYINNGKTWLPDEFLIKNPGYISCLALNSDAAFCSTPSHENGEINVWNTYTAQPHAIFKHTLQPAVTTLVWQRGNFRLWAGYNNGDIFEWDVNGERIVWDKNTTNIATTPVTALSPDGPECIVSGHQDGIAYLWDVRIPRPATCFNFTVNEPLISVHSCTDYRYAFHLNNRLKGVSEFYIYHHGKLLGNETSFDQGVAYAYDETNKNFLCATKNQIITTFDAHLPTNIQ